MTELSKHRYLQVNARRSSYVWRNIRLPENWDGMTDTQREVHIKQACFEHWQEFNDDSSDYYNLGKTECRWWHYAKPDDLDVWSVGDTLLAEVVTQPEEWLVLNGLYAKNADEYWNESDDDDD